jgi:hypothetical protein
MEVMEVLADDRQIDFYLQPERENCSGCFLWNAGKLQF